MCWKLLRSRPGVMNLPITAPDWHLLITSSLARFWTPVLKSFLRGCVTLLGCHALPYSTFLALAWTAGYVLQYQRASRRPLLVFAPGCVSGVPVMQRNAALEALDGVTSSQVVKASCCKITRMERVVMGPVSKCRQTVMFTRQVGR